MGSEKRAFSVYDHSFMSHSLLKQSGKLEIRIRYDKVVPFSIRNHPPYEIAMVLVLVLVSK